MTAVLARIAFRYIAGALIAKGVLSPSMGEFLNTDPDIAAAVEIVAGLALGAATEGFYLLARRFGWAK